MLLLRRGTLVDLAPRLMRDISGPSSTPSVTNPGTHFWGTNSSLGLMKSHLTIESTRFRKAPRFIKSKERKGIATDNEEPLENGSYRELFNVLDDPFCRGTDRRW
jgi:hypothetical protein